MAFLCGGSGKGRLLLADGGSIFAYDVGSAQATLVTAPVGGNGVVLRQPAESPDGKRIAYVRALQPAGANTNGDADELWIANEDGSDPHPSVQNANVEIGHLQWLDDQTVLAVIRTGSSVDLERIDAGTGERTPLADGVDDFALSRDRSSLALLRSSQEGATELSIAGADGGNERHLASTAPSSVITAIAFAPDGRTVAYATASGSDAAGDLWSVTAAGGVPAHIASLTEPVAGLTYGRDASVLYACSSATLWEIAAASGTATHLRDERGASTLAWAP